MFIYSIAGLISLLNYYKNVPNGPIASENADIIHIRKNNFLSNHSSLAHNTYLSDALTELRFGRECRE